jgi:hypothetical protein
MYFIEKLQYFNNHAPFAAKGLTKQCHFLVALSFSATFHTMFTSHYVLRAATMYSQK